MKLVYFSFSFFMLCLLFSPPAMAQLSGVETAKKHTLVYNKPAPDFFEGALLGNGGMGVVVTTRPDAVVLYFGHNNVWDIRIAEQNKEKLGTFQEVFDRVKQIPAGLKNLTDDPWYAAYNRMASENYSKPYPRPFPCGSVLLGFDRRELTMLGHELDISNGLCKVKFLTSGHQKTFLNIFTEMNSDRLWMDYTDSLGRSIDHPFTRVKIMPDPSTPKEFPASQSLEQLDQGILAFRQILPANERNPSLKDPKDKAFKLAVQFKGSLLKKSRMNWNGNKEEMSLLEAGFTSHKEFLMAVSLEEGLDAGVSAGEERNTISQKGMTDAFGANVKAWNSYWSKSSVWLADDFLEQIWYRNLYFFNCAAKEGVSCPGIFANWSYNDIGTAWHGDYHMNYNTQQPFWMTFSSNHLEKNLPYVNLIEALVPVSRKWAKDYYGLPGMYIPHSAYPVEMTMNPYPVPDWGWEVSETPWAIQGLWWHYLYSGDREFLKNRAYQPIKEAVQFLTAYMQRKDAVDPSRWKDHKYHIFPTVPPELYGLRPGFKYNYDGIVDLTLTKFAFEAFKKATVILGKTNAEKQLLVQIDDILKHFPEYPTAISKDYGKIFVSVPEENDQVVYNLPNSLFTVFPGEDHGLDTQGETANILQNSYRSQQNEGGNDLVLLNLQAARIGKLDLEAFKRQVNYSLLSNGTATDLVMQTGGRYNDYSDYKYMAKMGIWFENFALPAVINECLLQGYNGKIRLFPNWPKEKDASFTSLRTAGAFLVSASLEKQMVSKVKIFSEQGNDLCLVAPWNKGYYTSNKRTGKKYFSNSNLVLKTQKGEDIQFYPEE